MFILLIGGIVAHLTGLLNFLCIHNFNVADNRVCLQLAKRMQMLLYCGKCYN